MYTKILMFSISVGLGFIELLLNVATVEQAKNCFMLPDFPAFFSKWVVQMVEHKEWISETDNDLFKLYYFQNSYTLQRLQI